jgi:hypothetical protein
LKEDHPYLPSPASRPSKSMSLRKSFKHRLHRLGDTIGGIFGTPEGTQSSTSLPVVSPPDNNTLTPLASWSDTNIPSAATSGQVPVPSSHTPIADDSLALDTRSSIISGPVPNSPVKSADPASHINSHPVPRPRWAETSSSAQAPMQPLPSSDPAPTSTPATSLQQGPNVQTGTTSDSWKCVKALQGVLSAVAIFGPIKAVVDVFDECIEVFEVGVPVWCLMFPVNSTTERGKRSSGI